MLEDAAGNGDNDGDEDQAAEEFAPLPGLTPPALYPFGVTASDLWPLTIRGVSPAGHPLRDIQGLGGRRQVRIDLECGDHLPRCCAVP